ncbi:MAG: right-handed parallel beta-helix repeat-containing protein, partial [Verrucomicrobiota bacterium]
MTRLTSLTEGGWVSNSAVVIHWVTYNVPGPETVHLEYSPDGGSSWSTIANGVTASDQMVVWDTTLVSDTPAGLLRITGIMDTNLTDQTTNFFVIRNAGLDIYINDGSNLGDVYTTGLGSPANLQATATQPLDSLITALSLFDLEPGDRIFLDAGTYSESQNVVFSRKDSGSVTHPVWLIGSSSDPNAACGPSIVSHSGSNDTDFALSFRCVEHVSVSNVLFETGYNGINIGQSEGIELRQVRSRNNRSDGILVSNSTDVLVSRSVVSDSLGRGFRVQSGSSNIRILQSISWNNDLGSLSQAGGDVFIRNSVMSASGSGRFVFNISGGGTVDSQHNSIFYASQARVGRSGFVIMNTIENWRVNTMNDLFSVGSDPLFFNPAGGDYHLQSTTGRREACVTNRATDAAHSPLIDTGDPLSVFANEEMPNGGRINIGIYGNHPDASLSLNGIAATGFVQAVTFADGGVAQGDMVTLRWISVGAVAGHTLSIEISTD